MIKQQKLKATLADSLYSLYVDEQNYASIFA